MDFGNMNLILCFDWAQLEPVMDWPLYSKLIGENRLAVDGSRLYKSCDTVISLIHQIRQSDPSEQGFRELLLRLRNGVPTPKDIELLNQRNINSMDETQVEEFKDAVHLFGTNEEAEKLNR